MAVKSKNAPHPWLDRAQGSIIGALTGDAAGATLEFIGHKPTLSEVNTAMQLKGGGVWRVAPGQITDDGEMTLALMQALIDSGNTWNSTKVASAYKRWYLSDPFDKGNTTSNALDNGNLGDIVQYVKQEAPSIADIVRDNASRLNMASKANGSLMRASSLGVWCSKLSIEDSINAALQDAQLTHPNPVCQWAGVAYVLAIRHLILNAGDAEGAVDVAFFTLRDELNYQSEDHSKGIQDVLNWIKEAQFGRLPPGYPQPGFVKIAFTYAFYHLIEQSTYVEALHKTLIEGGDTDTNACIVGGLVGALHGLSKIPSSLSQKVLTCDVSQGRDRPVWLQARYCPNLVAKLIT